MKIYSLQSNEARQILSDLEKRRTEATERAFKVADEAIAGVRSRGDAFVAEQIEKFDRVKIEPNEIAMEVARDARPSPGAQPALSEGEGRHPLPLGEGRKRELQGLLPAGEGGPERSEGPDEGRAQDKKRAQEDRRAPSEISPDLAAAIDTAIERVDSFHRAQLPPSYRWTSGDTTIDHRVRPLRRIGIYVPGGRAVYISTLIMCAVPARIAGVQEIVVATTPAAAARPELQYAARKLGVKQIYRSGGAAGIAALALGTPTLARVDKIAGPGNSYVTAAKARLLGEVGIDMTAGPTELVVIADDTAQPELVAADLLAQAEHGPDSAVICVSTSASTANAIAEAVKEPAGRLEHGGPVFIFTTDSIDAAIDLANQIAPEHLSIQARNAAAIADRAMNCGAIYCGRWSVPAAGDYVIGSNHVLPTSGTGRFFSPLGVYDFIKRTNVIVAGEKDAASVAAHADRIARFEGLPMHAESVMARLSGPEDSRPTVQKQKENR